MMPPALQNKIVELGRPPIDPMHEMMTVAERRRPVTARVDASAVAELQRAMLRGRDRGSLPTEIENFTFAPGQQMTDSCVARDPADGGKTDRPSAGETSTDGEPRGKLRRTDRRCRTRGDGRKIRAGF